MDAQTSRSPACACFRQTKWFFRGHMDTLGGGLGGKGGYKDIVIRFWDGFRCQMEPTMVSDINLELSSIKSCADTDLLYPYNAK